MARVDATISQLITDYHTYQGDTNIRVILALKIPMGGLAYLVRFDDKYGVHCSSIDTIFHDSNGKPYATEMYGDVRSKERELVSFTIEEQEYSEDDCDC